MKSYKITIGTGLVWPHEEVIQVEDWECEQDALDRLVDKFESENQMGYFITNEEAAEYGEDEYTFTGNHGLNLLHYGELYIEEVGGMIEKIKSFLKNNNYSAKGMENHFKNFEFRAMTTNYTSGIVKIRGVSYYFSCIAPWLMCPDGKIEVEITN